MGFYSHQQILYAPPSGQILNSIPQHGLQDIDCKRPAGTAGGNSMPGDAFHTTRWTVVLEAKSTESEVSRRALSELCSSYWQPLFWFTVGHGASREEARDLTQAFFAHLLEHDFLRVVTPEAGKFRSFLLASLRHFLADEAAKDRALKRGGNFVKIPLDPSTESTAPVIEPVDHRSPEDAFERQWALNVLQNAVGRLSDDEEAAGRGDQFEKLKGCLTGEGPDTPYARLAEDLETSEAAVKMAVRRLRKRFGKTLRAEVAGTIDRGQDVDQEARYLLTVLKS